MKTRSLLTTALAALLPLGCSHGGPAPSASPTAPRKVIALSVLTLTNPFFKVIGDSMADEGAKHGYDVLVVSGVFDVAKQQNQVKDFIVRKVAAIVL